MSQPALASEAVSLTSDWAEIIGAMNDGGTFTFRTSSGGILVEQTGAFTTFKLLGEGRIGSVVSDDLDVRFLFRHWTAGQAHPAHTTLDFIDVTGQVCTSIHASDDQARETLERVIGQFGTNDAAPPVPAAGRRPAKPDSEVDIEALRADWAAMTNVHHFEALLGRHGLGRVQAFRLVGGDYASELSADAVPALFEALDASGEEIMIFVANRGMVQIYSGPARGHARVGHGWEVMNGASKVYLPDSALDHIWLVNKPTAAGIISSLEICSESEDQALASIFGRHPHGDAQPEGWLDLLNTLPRR